MTTDYFDLENKRSILIENTLNTASYTLRVFLFYKYFSDILSLGDKKTEEAFLQEFVDDYLSALSKFEVWGVDPGFIEKLITHLSDLKGKEIISGKEELLSNIINSIDAQYRRLLLILEGRITGHDYGAKASFPLIEQDIEEGFFGIIESVVVRISKANEKDNFIIIPSDKNIDERITEQCRNSWHVALKALKRYVRKPFRYHEVIVNFERKEGYYEGDSLGIALTVSFLKELMNFYNPVYSLEIEPGSAFTGAVTGEGRTRSTGGKIIRQKSKAVFYSSIETFIIPKTEESDALKEINNLKNKYPGRKLKLIPVEDIADILNRRDLIEIKRRNLALRTGRFIRKNLLLVLINILLLIIISFFLIKDIDTNPFTFTVDGRKIYIKNKSGRVLWDKNVSVSAQLSGQPGYLKSIVRIIDINEDGGNEVIIAGEDNEGRILRCLRSDGTNLWNYEFDDKVYSLRETLNTEYGLRMLDTLSFLGEKSLFLIASNYNSFSSAVIRIDIETGKRLRGTFWCSGHIIGGILKDINNDSTTDIIGIGYDNGYEDAVFFIYKPDTTTKVRPTTDEYLIRSYPVSEMKHYLRFPKSDYDIYYHERTPALGNTVLIDDRIFRKFKFGIENPHIPSESEFGYEINYDFKNIEVVINSRFRVLRDTLVAHGELKLPYTDTEAYKNILKNKILYFESGKWVKRDELQQYTKLD